MTTSINSYKNHIFQAVSATIVEGCNPPAAVITESIDSWDCSSYTLNPLAFFNEKTRIAFYQGLFVLTDEAVKEFCEGKRALEGHSDISVKSFYETLDEAEKAIENLDRQYCEEREEKHPYEYEEE